jgi:glycosyltransferase involved in cell wall biosynthesis
MKILFVVSGTKLVAASRYRVYQYLPYLEKQGVKYEVFSIISDFVTRLAIRSPEFNRISRIVYYIVLFIEKFFRFWFVFFKAYDFDLIFLQRATFPFGLGKILRLRNKKIIFDIDDAIFLSDIPGRGIVTKCKAFIKEREVRDILRIARSVIVENGYIKDYVSKYCENVYKIPGPIDTERYFVKERETGSEVVLGWIGSPATTAYLHLLDGVFSEILSRFKNVKIVLIGTGNYGFASDRVLKKDWSYENEVNDLQGFDIGLMPMPDDKWTRGKLGCKMLQYMAVGVPTVASYTPTNAELIKNGENSFLVKTESEWLEKLSLLIGNKELMEGIGKKGRETIEKICSVQKNTPRLLQIFRSLK